MIRSRRLLDDRKLSGCRVPDRVWLDVDVVRRLVVGVDFVRTAFAVGPAAEEVERHETQDDNTSNTADGAADDWANVALALWLRARRESKGRVAVARNVENPSGNNLGNLVETSGVHLQVDGADEARSNQVSRL